MTSDVSTNEPVVSTEDLMAEITEIRSMQDASNYLLVNFIDLNRTDRFDIMFNKFNVVIPRKDELVYHKGECYTVTYVDYRYSEDGGGTNVMVGLVRKIGGCRD